MRHIVTVVMVMAVFMSANARRYSYTFSSTPISQALMTVGEDHPELNLSFIYKELEKYQTSAHINTDNPYIAIKEIVGLNPISVIQKNNDIYVEALQHGRFVYKGRAVGADNEPVIAATVMILEPKDSTVLTYGISDDAGRFSIPCDRQGVIGKLTCIGYAPTYRKFNTFNVGTIRMVELQVALKSVTVEARNASLYADKSVFIPSNRQKNASQTGIDLLSHIAIPQLGLISNGNVMTNSGKPVAIFIDYLPATDTDLNAMLTSDVKKVEYYENPSDPRLQGNPYVINFVMQKYEYGGYLKTLGHTNLISNPVGELHANLRLQRNKMTYDIMGATFSYNRKNMGSELTETYRLPQPDGEIKEFTRFSNTTSSVKKQDWYFATLKATYNSDNVQAQSQIKGKIDRMPDNKQNGIVSYTPEDYPTTDYSSSFDQRTKFLAYEGYYFFKIPHNNSLTFNPKYNYSHTDQSSMYAEYGFNPIFNYAKDNTNKFSGELKFVHNFGKYGNLLIEANGSYESNKTRYSGSATALDIAKSSRIEIGATYDISFGKFYSSATFAWDWDRLKFGELIDHPSTPKANLSIQYAPNTNNSFNLMASYESWLPSPSFKSDKIIEATPLMRYTGNPGLVPSKSYDFDFTYTWIPNNNFNLSAFAWAWIVGDRYVYDYEASSSGILRTIKQPMGSFAQGTYGISGSAKFLDRSLVFSGRVGHLLNHNGRPYNANHSFINWYIRARYYLNNWNFTLTYSSKNGSADGCMNGLWAYGKSDWYITIGWSNSHWNIRGDIINFTRWNWRGDKYIMHSKFYDTKEVKINGSSRAYVQLVATYTFGFGKKVKSDNEPSVSGSASSGILK